MVVQITDLQQPHGMDPLGHGIVGGGTEQPHLFLVPGRGRLGRGGGGGGECVYVRGGVANG